VALDRSGLRDSGDATSGQRRQIGPMPTQSEQKALAFVAIVVLLAGVVRVVKAGGAGQSPSPAQQQGLARQAFAANSAAVAQKAAKTGPKQKKARSLRLVAPKGRDTVPNVVGGVASVPWNDPRGFPPPVPRIDVVGPAADTPLGNSAGKAAKGRKKSTRATDPQATGPIDLDTATEGAIESLPRIGPALAHRIVANRDSLGPFRSMEGLRRVKGIGPATVALITPLVTFSRQARP
jgi:DNA uptake protein ComE-like DNA-binding protein